MTDTNDLALRLADRLSPELLAFLKTAAAEASARKWRLYLVGGAVRDLLLGRPGFDMDLSVEGDAIELARALAAAPEDVTVHHRFNTARLRWGAHHFDLARSREETYARPGALPSVRPGSIENDLFRRDFTINAMALSLNADDWGRLIDVYGGRGDLEDRLIRVLHPNSFIDDATRIWRAVRYEQRLDFRIEPGTLALLEHDRNMLETITADRLRYELECILSEAAPEKIFRRADKLGLLKTWHPALMGDGWLSGACERARSLVEKPSPEVFLALLAWRLSASQKEELIGRLRLTRHQSRAIHDSDRVAAILEILASADIKPSHVYRVLHGLTDDALIASRAATDAPAALRNMGRFMTEWRFITTALTGEDLKHLGAHQGPDIKRLLDELRDRRLDGVITSRTQEESYVQSASPIYPNRKLFYRRD